MQKTSSMYTRSSMGIDYRVWLTLIVTILLSAILFGFKMATNVVCHKIDITLKGVVHHQQNTAFFVGESIIFQAKMKNGTDIEWDFGDGSEVVKGAKVNHSFAREGNYMVTATVDGKCVESINVHISQVAMGASSGTEAVSITDGIIIGKDFATAGELAIFQSASGATAYEWSIENNPTFEVKTAERASYSFTEAGIYIVKLKLDNDDTKVYKKTITVTAAKISDGGDDMVELPPLPLPAPPKDGEAGGDGGIGGGEEPKPTERKVEILPDPMFAKGFQEFIDGKGTLEDIAKYLCDGMGTKVRGNGKFYSNLTLFGEELKGKKGMLGLGGKRKIKSVKANRDSGNQCVFRLDVEYK